jgi:hypothetical protein
VDLNTASKYANFGEDDGSLLAHRSRPDRSTPKAPDPLTMRAAFVVVTLVSLGLWAAIWLVIFSLA